MLARVKRGKKRRRHARAATTREIERWTPLRPRRRLAASAWKSRRRMTPSADPAPNPAATTASRWTEATAPSATCRDNAPNTTCSRFGRWDLVPVLTLKITRSSCAPILWGNTVLLFVTWKQHVRARDPVSAKIQLASVNDTPQRWPRKSAVFERRVSLTCRSRDECARKRETKRSLGAV